jgi:hypothetical protein
VTAHTAAAEWSDLAKESAARAAVPGWAEGNDLEEAFRAATEAPLGALTVEALYARRKALHRKIELLYADSHDTDEALSEQQGDASWATWHRLMARSLRTGDAQDQLRADAAWARAMAEGHLRRGTQPAPTDHRAADVLAEMGRIAP